VSAYQTSDPHRWSTADTIAGFLATLSMFASGLGLIWRPVRILPFALLIALVAARMSARNERIAFYALLVGVVCWVAGMTIAVVTENPLY
jgi:hypothetical protein